jgi:ubiquinone/menaquinone biosynthesis C-methylase UbiE
MFRRRVRAASLVMLTAVTLPVSARAQLASRSTEEWIRMLDAPDRVAALKVDDIISTLGLKPGDVVADLGAGSGVFSIALARAVGPGGKVYAVDIDRGLLDHIDAKAKDQKIANVQTVLGRFVDPALPRADVDLAFMHDVLHHVEDRAGYLKNAAGYLKPTGRFAILEPDARNGPHREDPKLQITKEQLAAWMADSGLVPSREFRLFDDKWYVMYVRK